MSSNFRPPTRHHEIARSMRADKVRYTQREALRLRTETKNLAWARIENIANVGLPPSLGGMSRPAPYDAFNSSGLSYTRLGDA